MINAPCVNMFGAHESCKGNVKDHKSSRNDPEEKLKELSDGVANMGLEKCPDVKDLAKSREHRLHKSRLDHAVVILDETSILKQVNKSKQLRFKLHERVECLYNDVCGNENIMVPGEVVKLWYRENDWPMTSLAPYQIRLDWDGCLIYAPRDTDDVIRAECRDSMSSRRKHMRPWCVCM